MAKPDALDLATRLIAALYIATSGKPGVVRRINDVAQQAGITTAADIDLAVKAAERDGFLVVKGDELLVMLTTEGRAAATGNRMQSW